MTGVKLAILGLGPAGEAMVPFIDGHSGVELAAVVDKNVEALNAHESRDSVAQLAAVRELVERPDIDAVYVSTPTPTHAELVVTLAEAGKHVIVEKPMATTLEEADRMIEAASAAEVTLMVGHSHSYEAPIREMKRIIDTGDLGALRAINGWNFTDWFYRPRHPEELDPTKGGGVALRQGSHHVDTVRYLAGGMAESVRAMTGDWDPGRPGEGSYHAFVEFVGGEVAMLAYSGYDHFSTTELTFGIGETGQKSSDGHATARHELAGMSAAGETAAKARKESPQRRLLAPGDHQPFFGVLVVSCTRGDMRIAPNGIRIYGEREITEIDLRREPLGRTAMLDELVAAVNHRTPAVHDGAWGRANLEACLAISESARTRSTVQLTRQSEMPPS